MRDSPKIVVDAPRRARARCRVSRTLQNRGMRTATARTAGGELRRRAQLVFSLVPPSPVTDRPPPQCRFPRPAVAVDLFVALGGRLVQRRWGSRFRPSGAENLR